MVIKASQLNRIKGTRFLFVIAVKRVHIDDLSNFIWLNVIA